MVVSSEPRLLKIGADSMVAGHDGAAIRASTCFDSLATDGLGVYT